MKNLVLCVTLNFLFFINTVYSTVEVTAGTESIHFSPKETFKLACNVAYSDSKEKPKIVWTKEGQDVKSIDSLKSRVSPKSNDAVNTLTVESATEDDVGNYSCIAYNDKEVELGRAEIVVTRKIAVKVPTNINIVEDEPLTIECKVVGNPRIHWMFKNETYTESRDRVQLRNYTDNSKVIENGIFYVQEIKKEDRGEVTCVGVYIYGNDTETDKCMIRIKDKYAALWPFLGICAEVIVLCAIIIIYEKKRNKTELDESDTDQSPDQKNTPDHGKEANLRHRQ